MELFEIVVVPELCDRIRELENILTITWERFENKLKKEFMDEGSYRITKLSFVDWMEQKLGRSMELLKEFERKYNQLPIVERKFLGDKKSQLFLQMADKALMMDLCIFVSDSTTKGVLTILKMISSVGLHLV